MLENKLTLKTMACVFLAEYYLQFLAEYYRQ